jgi:two-component system NtrC family sensor kinase
VLIVCVAVSRVLADAPLLPALALLTAGIVIVALALRNPRWEVPLHALAAALLGILAGWAASRVWWLALMAVGVVAATLWLARMVSGDRLREAEDKAERLAAQVDRRISELFSLRELSYVLSESIQLDRIVEQVVRYTSRFVQADGVVLVLAESDGRALRVAAASGTLASLLGQVSEGADGSLVRVAIERDRIEVQQGESSPAVHLIAGVSVRSAAVAPLKAQGITMGALALADRNEGPFTTEDLWLLSTVATNASVVLANSRLYEMVRRGEEEWETAFDALTEGIAVVGTNGAVLRANKALAGLAGLAEADLVGRNFCQTLFGSSEAVSSLIEAAHRGERTVPMVVRPDESHQVLRLTAAPLAAAERGSVVILIEDVTEQRALEAQIIQSDKMASIGQLVSGVAHELNNPLTSIAGLSELLLERPPHPELPREHLRVIHDQAERAGRIVRNLLTFARKGVAEKTAVDLNDVVTRTSLLIMYELQLHGIELESQLSPTPPIVVGDRYELQQVLLNLVTNAVQAVSGLPADAPRRITLATSRAEDRAVLLVRDNGPGVPRHLAPYLFTPFFTTKAPGEGTGLGLSVSYGLVKAHDGDLSYEPSAEGGAEFRVSLPLFSAELADLVNPVATENGGHDRGRILVVDEDPAVHRMLSALFSPDGYEVETVQNGEQALKMATEREYDLIIADRRMGAGATDRFTQVLLDSCPHVRDRLVVACSRDEALSAASDQPAVRTVTKPFNLRDLRSVAGEILQ